MIETLAPVQGDMIYSKMPLVMKDVGGIAKNRTNPQQGYDFRGIDEIYEHCQLALANHGVFVIPFVVEREREERTTQKGGAMFSVRLLVDHRFYAADGSYVIARTLGEAMDSGDKASNKAMSAAIKYALIESLCIPTREPIDTEESSPEVAGKAKVPAPKERETMKDGAIVPVKSAPVPTAGEPALPSSSPPAGAIGIDPKTVKRVTDAVKALNLGDRQKNLDYLSHFAGRKIRTSLELTEAEGIRAAEAAEAGEAMP